MTGNTFLAHRRLCLIWEDCVCDEAATDSSRRFAFVASKHERRVSLAKWLLPLKFHMERQERPAGRDKEADGND